MSSIQFSDTTNLSGLIQLYESQMGYDYGYISGDTTRRKSFTAAANLARRRYFSIAIKSSGTWELDDSEHEDYAVIYATLSAGQNSYAFTDDGNGNAILDIYKVLIKPTIATTEYQELYPVDENQPENISIISESGVTGNPIKYSKRANAIHFDVNPTETVSRGIKILVNREPTYYLESDTTKPTGFPYFPEYFFLRPVYEEGLKGKLSDATFNRLSTEILKLEGDESSGRVGLIAKAYGNRRKDEIDSISGEYINSK